MFFIYFRVVSDEFVSTSLRKPCGLFPWFLTRISLILFLTPGQVFTVNFVKFLRTFIWLKSYERLLIKLEIFKKRLIQFLKTSILKRMFGATTFCGKHSYRSIRTVVKVLENHFYPNIIAGT